MLEKQQACLDGADIAEMKPILLSVDAGAVRARRKLAELIDAEN